MPHDAGNVVFRSTLSAQFFLTWRFHVKGAYIDLRTDQRLALKAYESARASSRHLSRFKKRIHMAQHWTRLTLVTGMGLVMLTAEPGFAAARSRQQPTASNTTSPAAVQPPAAAPEKVSPGTMIQVEMSSDVDVKKAHVGDVFRTKLWADVRSGGKIILPQKTIIVGHVVEALPRSKANPESKLTIAFDNAVLKDGSMLPLRGVVARVQLSPMAVAAGAGAKPDSYNPGLVPGSTTNIAMPAQLPLPGEGGDKNQLPTPGPTNVRDTSIVAQGDASGALTVLTSSNKTDVRLKHYATLDVRITHAGEQ